MPSTHEMPAMPFPISSHLEKMLPSGLSPMHFMHPQQMNHGQMGSNCTKEELVNSCMMQGQHQYLHDLHNQQLEYSNQFESFGNATFGKLRFLRSPKKKCCFEYPVSHNLEQSKHDGFSNGAANYAGSEAPWSFVMKINGFKFFTRLTDPVNSFEFVTRAVQKLIETLKTPEQFSMIVSLLKPGIVILMKNINGNHVAQHCLQFLVSEYIEFLFDAAMKCCAEVATDRHGCCVLQKCLSCSDHRQRDRLLTAVVCNALFLSQDQYGNYVVQFAFDLARNPTAIPWVISGILKRLEGHFADLSIQKYSSNVVEKCASIGEEYLTKIIDELINDERFSQIMLNPYGNYAVQAVLAHSGICKGSSLHANLVAAIRPHVPLLRTNMYGKKVLGMLGKVN
ncbi:Pumilio-like 12, partial [Cucurbita argyrosperma subsp. argyrosperma]